MLRREAPSRDPPLGLPWPVRPEALLVPSAAALLLLAGHGQLHGQLQPAVGSSSGSGQSAEQQQPRSAAEAHLMAQRAWQQRQQLPVLTAPSLGAAAPRQHAPTYQPATAPRQQGAQEQQDAVHASQPQRSSGADRPLQFDSQTAGALAACMVVSWRCRREGSCGGRCAL